MGIQTVTRHHLVLKEPPDWRYHAHNPPGGREIVLLVSEKTGFSPYEQDNDGKHPKMMKTICGVVQKHGK